MPATAPAPFKDYEMISYLKPTDEAHELFLRNLLALVESGFSSESASFKELTGKTTEDMEGKANTRRQRVLAGACFIILGSAVALVLGQEAKLWSTAGAGIGAFVKREEEEEGSGSSWAPPPAPTIPSYAQFNYVPLFWVASLALIVAVITFLCKIDPVPSERVAKLAFKEMASTVRAHIQTLTPGHPDIGLLNEVIICLTHSDTSERRVALVSQLKAALGIPSTVDVSAASLVPTVAAPPAPPAYSADGGSSLHTVLLFFTNPGSAPQARYVVLSEPLPMQEYTLQQARTGTGDVLLNMSSLQAAPGYAPPAKGSSETAAPQ